MIKKWVLLWGCINFVQPTWANDMALGGSGGSPYPIKQSHVSMQSERIIIRGSKLSRRFNERSWRVYCRYIFKNHSKQTQTMRVGFPYSVLHEGYVAATPPGERHKLGQSMLYGFVTRVNGRRVVSKEAKLSPELSVEQDLDYSRAYVFPMKIKPMARVKVEHRYRVGVTAFPNRTLGAHYILRTGRLWREGVIGHAVFEVIPGVKTRLCGEFDKKPHKNIQPKPAGITVVGKGKKRRYKWDLHNFVPTHDLSLCLQTAQSYIHNKYVVYLVAPDRFKQVFVWQYTSQQLRFILNAIQAQYGKPFRNKLTQKEFNQQWWYSKDPRYSDDRLSDQDKKAIAWINERIKRLEKQPIEKQPKLKKV